MIDVKISINPYTPSIEVVENFVMTVHVPYSDKNVVIKIDSNIEDYLEKDDKNGVSISQFMVSSDTVHTKTLEFDFEDNKTNKITVDSRTFSIELIEIGNEIIDDSSQQFKYFRFEVSEL